MDFASIENFDKVIKDEVTKVPVGEDSYYLRIAGPLSFDIIECMSDETKSQKERSINTLIACLCDKEGRRLFKHDNPEHFEKVEAIKFQAQVKLLQEILGFFGIKKNFLEGLE
jgi:hypothetical protein